MPQAQAAQQRLIPESAPSVPPSYGQVSNSSKVNRREGHLAPAQMKLVIFTLFFCSSAECSSPAAAASRRHRRGLCTDLGTTIKYMRRTASGAAGNCLVTTIKYLRRTRNGGAGNDLGITVKYLWPTTSPRRRYIAASATLPLCTRSSHNTICSSAYLPSALLLMRSAVSPQAAV